MVLALALLLLQSPGISLETHGEPALAQVAADLEERIPRISKQLQLTIPESLEIEIIVEDGVCSVPLAESGEFHRRVLVPAEPESSLTVRVAAAVLEAWCAVREPGCSGLSIEILREPERYGFSAYREDIRGVQRALCGSVALEEFGNVAQRHEVFPWMSPAALRRLQDAYRQGATTPESSVDPNPWGDRGLHAGVQDEGLVLRLHADRHVFLPGQKVPLLAQLENQSGRRICLPARSGYLPIYVSVEVPEPLMGMRGFGGGCGTVAPPGAVWLEPGQSIFQRVTVDRRRLPGVGMFRAAAELSWGGSYGRLEGWWPISAEDADEEQQWPPQEVSLCSAEHQFEFAVPDAGLDRVMLAYVMMGALERSRRWPATANDLDRERRGIEQHMPGAWGDETVYLRDSRWWEPARRLRSLKADGWRALDESSTAELIAELESWELGPWIDDALYTAARHLESHGRDQEAVAILVHTATKYPDTDFGVRAWVRAQAQEMDLER